MPHKRKYEELEAQLLSLLTYEGPKTFSALWARTGAEFRTVDYVLTRMRKNGLIIPHRTQGWGIAPPK